MQCRGMRLSPFIPSPAGFAAAVSVVSSEGAFFCIDLRYFGSPALCSSGTELTASFLQIILELYTLLWAFLIFFKDS